MISGDRTPAPEVLELVGEEAALLAWLVTVGKVARATRLDPRWLADTYTADAIDTMATLLGVYEEFAAAQAERKAARRRR